MEDRIKQLEDIVTGIGLKFDSLSSSASIPYSVENAFTDRLSKNMKLFTRRFIAGSVTMSSGTATVTNGLITSASVAIITTQTATAQVDVGGVCSSGTLTISSSSGTDSRTVSYLIFI